MIELDLKGVSGVGGVVLNPGKYCSTAYLFCAEAGGGGGGGFMNLYGACGALY